MQEPVDRFAWFFDTCYDDVLRYAARRIDPDTARDVAAETFLVAWRRLSEVPQVDGDILPWLYGVARNVLANEYRRERRSQRLLQRIARSLSGPMSEDDHGDDVTAVMGLRQALQSLPPRDQEVLQLIGWEELTIRQAAIVIGCSPATMAVKVHRARRRFLAILDDQGTPAPILSIPRRTER
ncbi:sigma-70 family RNA polymerase sigma factor [Streptosporangium sp. NPDC000239]|uniref:RNA polymerase sigma factor n=1 Tax=Streptosporangium sp. NPDC000239 TaxID=3154248 RepID=UPI00332AF14D